MVEIRIGAAAVASTAVISFLLPPPPAVNPIRIHNTSRMDPATPDGLLHYYRGLEVDETLHGVEGVDFGELTAADVEMMRAAATAGAFDIDLSDFFDEDE